MDETIIACAIGFALAVLVGVALFGMNGWDGLP